MPSRTRNCKEGGWRGWRWCQRIALQDRCLEGRGFEPRRKSATAAIGLQRPEAAPGGPCSNSPAGLAGLKPRPCDIWPIRRLAQKCAFMSVDQDRRRCLRLVLRAVYSIESQHHKTTSAPPSDMEAGRDINEATKSLRDEAAQRLASGRLPTGTMM